MHLFYKYISLQMHFCRILHWRTNICVLIWWYLLCGRLSFTSRVLNHDCNNEYMWLMQEQNNITQLDGNLPCETEELGAGCSSIILIWKLGWIIIISYKLLDQWNDLSSQSSIWLNLVFSWVTFQEIKKGDVLGSYSCHWMSL